MEKVLLYKGKSKSVYAGENINTCILNTGFGYSRKRRKKAELDVQGALNAEISSILYQYLEKYGIETHFIKT